jgi:hypothetical protein
VELFEPDYSELSADELLWLWNEAKRTQAVIEAILSTHTVVGAAIRIPKRVNLA